METNIYVYMSVCVCVFDVSLTSKFKSDKSYQFRAPSVSAPLESCSKETLEENTNSSQMRLQEESTTPEKLERSLNFIRGKVPFG